MGIDLKETLASMQEWVSRYDNKASILLGIDIAMLGFLATSAPSKEDWTAPMVWGAAIAAAALALAIVALLWSNIPRTKPPKPSLHFFGSIAEMKLEDYVQAATSQRAAEAKEDLARQIHAISVILRTKFRALKVSYWASLLALAPWATTIFLFRVGGT